MLRFIVSATLDSGQEEHFAIGPDRVQPGIGDDFIVIVDGDGDGACLKLFTDTGKHLIQGADQMPDIQIKMRLAASKLAAKFYTEPAILPGPFPDQTEAI